jgi:ubiquinone/menaquinone biosynthesis C-methylase UbiE
MSVVTNYDAVAAGYDLRYQHFDYREVEAALMTFLGEQPLSGILEVGCGTGHWLRVMAGRAPTIAGVDLSAEMIARARPTGALLARARAEALPWIDASFDRLACVNALHHFADRGRFFAEARRVLKPSGGLFTIGLDPHAERDTWWVYDYFPETRDIDRQRFAPVRTIRGETAKAGFAWCESGEAQTFEHVMPAEEAFARGLVDPRFTSQLAVLSQEAFDAGAARLREAMAASARAGGPLMLASELHLFTVTAWVG